MWIKVKFLEYLGSIEYHSVFGFFGPRQSLPYILLKHAVTTKYTLLIGSSWTIPDRPPFSPSKLPYPSTVTPTPRFSTPTDDTADGRTFVARLREERELHNTLSVETDQKIPARN